MGAERQREREREIFGCVYGKVKVLVVKPNCLEY